MDSFCLESTTPTGSSKQNQKPGLLLNTSPSK